MKVTKVPWSRRRSDARLRRARGSRRARKQEWLHSTHSRFLALRDPRQAAEGDRRIDAGSVRFIRASWASWLHV